jgi:hypothetical protein
MTTTSQRPPDFGRRKRSAPDTAASQSPSKRSAQVGLMLMGVVAVGGGAYALMPSENCEPAQAVNVAPGQTNVGCAPRSSSSSSSGWSSSSRSGWTDSSSSSSAQRQGLVAASPLDSSTAHAGNTTRGGFGSFTRSFSSHFTGGG